jgi:hypothetical protein
MAILRVKYTYLLLFFFTTSAVKSQIIAPKQRVSKMKVNFLLPKDNYKPGVYWYFMDGNLSKESISKDLKIDEKSRYR